jgi:hypothetical protein
MHFQHYARLGHIILLLNITSARLDTLYVFEPSGRMIQCMSLNSSHERPARQYHFRPIAAARPGHINMAVDTLYVYEPFVRMIQCISFNSSHERYHFRPIAAARPGHINMAVDTLYVYEPFVRMIQCISVNNSSEEPARLYSHLLGPGVLCIVPTGFGEHRLVNVRVGVLFIYPFGQII